MKRKELKRIVKEDGLVNEFKELKKEAEILSVVLWAMKLEEKLYNVLEEKDVNEKKVRKVINDSFED